MESDPADPSNQDRRVDRVLASIRKEYIVVGKTRVRAWQAWLLIGIAAGIAAGIILVANRSGEVEMGRAAQTLSACERGWKLFAYDNSPPTAAVLPESHTAYWYWSFYRDPKSTTTMNTAFKVAGQFPSTRFLGLQTIGSYALESTSTISDNKIIPNDGNANPFVVGADRYATNRSYTLWFVPYGSPHRADPNTIEMPPTTETTIPQLEMRFTRPDSGDYVPESWKAYGAAQGWAPLPIVTAYKDSDHNGQSISCPSPATVTGIISDAVLTKNGGVQVSYYDMPSPENPISFYHMFEEQGLAASYLAARLDSPAKGNIAILRLKVPTFPDTYNQPLMPLTGVEEVRYASLCVNTFVLGLLASPCLADDELVKKEIDGFSYVVVGPDPKVDSSVKDTAVKKGYHYMSWEDAKDIILLYRNRAPADSFSGSAAKVPKYGDTSVCPPGRSTCPYQWRAQNTIGDYAPVGRVCPKEKFVAGTCDFSPSIGSNSK